MTFGLMLQAGKLVVLDAGHGGFDPGAIGRVTGVEEDELNLAVANALAELLEARGYRVLKTRSDDKAIAGTKVMDMDRRRDIIEKSGADAAISIHMNAIQQGTVRGPVAIYYEGSDEGKLLAQCMQRALNESLMPPKPKQAASGSYFILKAGSMPSCIVECGFLTNAEEERLLMEADYQQQVALAIADGLDAYFANGVLPAPQP